MFSNCHSFSFFSFFLHDFTVTALTSLRTVKLQRRPPNYVQLKATLIIVSVRKTGLTRIHALRSEGYLFETGAADELDCGIVLSFLFFVAKLKRFFLFSPPLIFFPYPHTSSTKQREYSQY